MALSFPASPTVGDIHTVGSRSWRWDGDIWSSKLNSESRWLQVLDDPGTSLTNWTSVDGTWGIDTYIENTDTSGWSYMEWNGSFDSTTVMIEAEFYVPTPGTANYPGGYICLARSSESGFNKIQYKPCVANYNNHTTGAGTWAMFISGSNDAINRHIELNNGIGAYDTWTTMSIVSDGGSFYGYINGNYIGNVGTADTRPWDTFAIACYGTEIKYRNIKAWQAVNDLPSGGQIPIPVEVLADSVSLTTSVDSIDFSSGFAVTESTADNLVVKTVENSIDIPPTSPDAMDDEFDAGTMDAKWTLSAPSGTPTVTFSDGLCHFTPYATASYDVQAMWQLLPGSGDWGFTLALEDFDGIGYQYNVAGMLALSEGTSGTGYQGIYIGAGTWSGGGVSVNTFNPWSTWSSAIVTPNGDGIPKYLRVAKVGSNYNFSVSTTGYAFVQAYTTTLGYTPGRILIGSKTENGSASPATANFKWFRKTA